MTVQDAAANLREINDHLKKLYGDGSIAMTSPALSCADVEASIATLEAAHG